MNKPLSGLLVCWLIMSLADKLTSKCHICPGGLASRPNIHFSDNLSAADIISRHSSRPKAEVDNTLRDLQNPSHPTNAKFNNCAFYYSFKPFSYLKLVNLLAAISLFVK